MDTHAVTRYEYGPGKLSKNIPVFEGLSMSIQPPANCANLKEVTPSDCLFFIALSCPEIN
jgi:hypothetical protein